MGTSNRQLWSEAGTAEQASEFGHRDMKMEAPRHRLGGCLHSENCDEPDSLAVASSCGSAMVAQPACVGVDDTVGVSENVHAEKTRDQGWNVVSRGRRASVRRGRGTVARGAVPVVPSVSPHGHSPTRTDAVDKGTPYGILDVEEARMENEPRTSQVACGAPAVDSSGGSFAGGMCGLCDDVVMDPASERTWKRRR